MAVAAYASLLSLSYDLDHIRHPSMHRRLSLKSKQIKNLQEKVHFLQEFLELHYQGECDPIDDVVRRIAKVANKAEYVIDFHVVNQLRRGHDDIVDVALQSFSRDIDEVIEKIDSITKQLLTMVKVEGKVVRENKLKVNVSHGPSTLASSGKSNVVGFDEHLVRIMDHLTEHQPDLQIIPIVGMGGIGKTTLARLSFENKFIVEHFDVRVWFTISQEYSMHEVLIGILRDLGVSGDLNSETLAHLKQRLHKDLFGKRYLIVMDDLWSTEAWDDFKLYFPDYENQSRIIITTRLSNVAVTLSSCIPYVMNFLDEDKSWNLFCEKAFAQKNHSPELNEPGKKIAKSCRGLPLAIVVIAGFLAKSNMTRAYWEFVARNINSDANLEKDEQCTKILALSYHHLPIHLKPCFLYMRVFPEDHEVQVPKLINLWIAEGLVKPLKDKKSEDVAEEYLKDLIDRNLILIREHCSIGNIKTCGIHDHLRDLCIRESHKERFFSVPRVQHIEFKMKREIRCFLCDNRNVRIKIPLCEVSPGSGSTSPFSTWVCGACRNKHPQLIRLRFINLQIRDYNDYCESFLLPTTLRCLSVNFVTMLKSLSFSSLRLLWKIKGLTMTGLFSEPMTIPSEIWEISQIRHMEIGLGLLPKPADNQIERKDHTVLENLHTLSMMLKFKLNAEFLKRIQNVKKLRIASFADSLLTNLARLSKLENLVLEYENASPEKIAFPHSLKALKMVGYEMLWEDMGIIGSLPNLEVLELRSVKFGSEWNPVEGEFLGLKYLSMKYLDLVRWRAEDIHFPRLEILELCGVKNLEEIPSGIGDIPTLREIRLKSCNLKVKNSAKDIIEEQRSMGNEDLQLYVS